MSARPKARSAEAVASSVLDNNSLRSLSDKAYENLLDMMLTGELPAGTVLQERRLAEALRISRTPVREALGRLESEGLVTRQFGRLLAVRQLSLREFIEILNVRKLLEVEAASLAIGRVGEVQANSARKAVRDLMTAKEPTVAQHWAVDDIVHGLVGEACGNQALSTLIRDLRRRTHMFNLRRVPGRFLPGCMEHLAIIDAVAGGDRERACSLIAQHIDNVKSSILEKLQNL